MNKGYIYKRRLLKLADFLDTLPRTRFNYESWVGDDWKGAADLSCGTTACALGWATTIPSLRKAGLVMRRDGYPSEYKGYVSLRRTLGEPEGVSSSTAAEEVFGLDYDEFEYLFIPGHFGGEFDLPDSPDEGATAKQVAKHIRRFVNFKYGK